MYHPLSTSKNCFQFEVADRTLVCRYADRALHLTSGSGKTDLLLNAKSAASEILVGYLSDSNVLE